MINEHLFNNRSDMFAQLTEVVTAALESQLEERGQAVMLASGGSTPEPLYEALSDCELSWEKVTAALVDERWVDADHDKSNYRFLKNALKKAKASELKLLGMKSSAKTAVEDEELCNSEYKRLSWPAAITILGMGPDGHTASLFPNCEGLEKALGSDQICTAINAIPSEVTGDFTERMTLTKKGILKTEKLILLITGEEKLAVLRTALSGGEVNDMPVRAITNQNEIDVELFWAP